MGMDRVVKTGHFIKTHALTGFDLPYDPTVAQGSEDSVDRNPIDPQIRNRILQDFLRVQGPIGAYQPFQNGQPLVRFRKPRLLQGFNGVAMGVFHGLSSSAFKTSAEDNSIVAIQVQTIQPSNFGPFWFFRSTDISSRSKRKMDIDNGKETAHISQL
jgi:hypothetical protein